MNLVEDDADQEGILSEFFFFFHIGQYRNRQISLIVDRAKQFDSAWQNSTLYGINCKIIFSESIVTP